MALQQDAGAQPSDQGTGNVPKVATVEQVEIDDEETEDEKAEDPERDLENDRTWLDQDKSARRALMSEKFVVSRVGFEYFWV